MRFQGLFNTIFTWECIRKLPLVTQLEISNCVHTRRRMWWQEAGRVDSNVNMYLNASSSILSKCLRQRYILGVPQSIPRIIGIVSLFDCTETGPKDLLDSDVTSFSCIFKGYDCLVKRKFIYVIRILDSLFRLNILLILQKVRRF